VRVDAPSVKNDSVDRPASRLVYMSDEIVVHSVSWLFRISNLNRGLVRILEHRASRLFSHCLNETGD